MREQRADVPTLSYEIEPEGRLCFLECGDNFQNRFFAVTKEHQGVLRCEERIGYPRETGTQAAFDDDDRP